MPNNEKYGLSVEELIKEALANNEGELAANGSLVVKTGARTGRSPKDRFIVRDAITDQTVDWNTINQAISPADFDSLYEKAQAYLQQLPHYYVSDLSVGANATYGIPVHVITEFAWHAIFTNVLFIREALPDNGRGWTILAVPNFKTDPKRDGVNSDAAVILNFTERVLLICGTQYAGEMKKGMFSVLNFMLPAHRVLPMHCAANASKTGDTALFFGLSGTGKTTLSADPERLLIGDDEHGWSSEGIFNFEGGCYAKCIDLSQKNEPLIWNAIKRGSVLENVIIDENSKVPDYHDVSLTQNTRAAYPREFIPERVPDNAGKQPKAVLFLCCDLYGVLPPVAKLTPLQAAYYFLSGYTALVGSTEVGQGSGIKPTFSTCFGAPFFPRPAKVYAELLLERLENSHAQVYLVNTGWTGGAHGEGGSRFTIPTTRSVVSAIIDNGIQDAAFEKMPGFDFEIPTKLDGVETHLLNPLNAWEDKAAYKRNANILIEQFIDNFKKFNNPELEKAGPRGF